MRDASTSTPDSASFDSAAFDAVAWHAVYDLSLRYAEGIDRRDWAAYATCFDDLVQVDFSSFTQRPAAADPVTAAEWIATVRATIDGFVSTQHLIGNHRITIESPDEGRYTAYVQAQHWMDRDRWYLLGGWYDNRVVRRADGWRLASVTINQTWDAGNRDLLREAYRRANPR